MNTLFIGQNSSGKTTNMKNYIQTLDRKVIVLDFSDEYDEFTDNVLYLDDVNPLLNELSLLDVQALNAGYLANSHCLHKKAEEIFREVKSSTLALQDQPWGDCISTLKKENIVEESIERLQISWDNTEMMYGKILNQKIPTKKYKKHISLSQALTIIQSHDRILLKSKSMHSDHLRAITFILLSNLSHNTTEPVYIVGDDLSSFFNNGNIRLFAQTICAEQLEFVLSFNKAVNIPKKLFPSFDTYYIHRFESKSEIRELMNFGIPVQENIKKLPIGECIKVNVVKQKGEVSHV